MTKRFTSVVLVLIVVSLGVLVAASRASAATLTVGSSPGCATIQDCIDTAGPGDTVSIPSGAYSESLTLTKAVSLVGDGPSATVISSAGGRVLTVEGAAVDAAVSISGLTLTGGDVSAGNVCAPTVPDFTNCGGGMLLAGDARPSLSDLVLSQNSAYRGGGLYAAPGSPIQATDVVLQDNVSILSGGGAYAHDDVDWFGGHISGNQSQFNVGGGVVVVGPDGLVVPKPTVVFDAARFEGNQTATIGGSITHGGALYLFHADALLTGSDFASNRCGGADCDGGAVYSSAAFVDVTLDIVDSTFTDNAASRSGGAVIGSGFRVFTSVSDSLFEDNEAGSRGGGLAAEHATITNGIFRRNAALGLTGSSFNEGAGGGVFVRATCSQIADSLFEANTAVDGGGVACGFGNLGLVDTDLIDNVANENGGGAFAGVGTTTVTGGILSGNIAGAAPPPQTGTIGPGAGGGLWSAGDASVEGVVVTGNEAIYGGGILVENGSLELVGGEVSANVATWANAFFTLGGGGVFVRNGDLIATATIVHENSTPRFGGGALVAGNAFLVDVQAMANGAFAGGALLVSGDVSIVGGTFSENEATGASGGAIQAGGFGTGGVQVDGTQFSSNRALLSGGAIRGDIVDIVASTFSGNEAASGGALSASSTTTIADSEFSDNHALDGNGGALTTFPDELLIESSRFTDNTATGSGGAINAFSSVELRETIVDGNSAGGNGGGVSTGGQLFADAATELVGNAAGGDGGGSYANSGGELNGTTVSGNQAGGDGGGLAMAGGLPDLLGVTIEANIAGGNGGGLIAFRPNLTETTIADNAAGGHGGGLFVRQRGTIIDTRITANTASQFGGGIYRESSSGSLPFEILRTTIDANTAVQGDGAFIAGSRPVVFENVTVSGDGLGGSGAGLVMANATIHNPGDVAVDSSASTVSAQNTLVVGSCTSPIVDGGGNLESPGATCGFGGPGVPTPGLVDPVLADNGGHTPTHALPLTSAAVDGGTDPCPTTDQRGALRLDLACDVGSFEFLPVSGCTPGYWKQRNHFDSWTDLTPQDQLSVIFGRPVDGSLLDGLKARGGGLDALLRHASAAALNATHPELVPGPGVDTLAEVVVAFQTAYDTGDYEPAKNAFEATNSVGCPLD